MRAESMRMDRLTRRRQLLVWRQEDYRQAASLLSTLREQHLRMERTNSISAPATFNSLTANVAGAGTVSGVGAAVAGGITVRTTSDASAGQYEITVNQSAQGDIFRGNSSFASLNVRTTSMDTFLGANGTWDANGYGSLVINDVRIDFHQDETIETVMARVNSSAANVTMRFNALHNTFEIASRSTGTADGTVSIGDRTTQATGTPAITFNEADSSGFLRHVGLAHGAPGSVSEGHAAGQGRVATAQNAEVTIRERIGASWGAPVTITSATNTIIAAGLVISVAGANNGDIYRADIVRNVEPLMDTIREFVESYNEMIRSLNAMHTTPRPRAGSRDFFQPLTDAERREMTDREIERWEEQARAGMMHRNPTLRNIHDQMRRWMLEGVDLGNGTTLSLHEIGITPAGFGHPEGMTGILVIDEDRLRQSLEERPDDVREMFTRSSTMPGVNMSQRSQRLGDQGIAQRLNDLIHMQIETGGVIANRAGITNHMSQSMNEISRQLRRYDDQLAHMQNWLIRRENHHFATFARMERAMAQAQAQMDTLWMFGAG
jgi:flagellar hook-associated protein 2